MQDAASQFVTDMLTSKSDTVDLFMWDREAGGYDKPTVFAAIYLSKEFQDALSQLGFPLSMDHLKAWFYLGVQPLTGKKKTDNAVQKRTDQGLPTNVWGGFALFVVRMSQRHSTARTHLVGGCLNACSCQSCQSVLRICVANNT